MKSILIKGASSSGKSTTMREVCKRLNPSKVYKLHINKGSLELSTVNEIFNDTFIIEVKGKFILVVAGAPTEQNIRLSVIIEVCVKIKIDISFALVSMRSFEKREGFDTVNELKKYSEIILVEKIHRINEAGFENNIQWKNRINKIVEIIESKI